MQDEPTRAQGEPPAGYRVVEHICSRKRPVLDAAQQLPRFRQVGFRSKDGRWQYRIEPVLEDVKVVKTQLVRVEPKLRHRARNSAKAARAARTAA